MNSEPLVRWDWLFSHLGPIADRVGQHIYLAGIGVAVGFAISFALASEILTSVDVGVSHE